MRLNNFQNIPWSVQSEDAVLALKETQCCHLLAQPLGSQIPCMKPHLLINNNEEIHVKIYA